MLALPEWPALNSEIFMHTVVPNLKRLGLITERTEAEYRRIGMIYGDRFDAEARVADRQLRGCAL